MIKKKEDSELRAFIQFLMEKTKNPTRLKPQQLHSVWRSVVAKRGADRKQQVHLVSVDVKDAYGSIIQVRLIVLPALSITILHLGFIIYQLTKKASFISTYLSVSLCSKEKKYTLICVIPIV